MPTVPPPRSEEHRDRSAVAGLSAVARTLQFQLYDSFDAEPPEAEPPVKRERGRTGLARNRGLAYDAVKVIAAGPENSSAVPRRNGPCRPPLRRRRSPQWPVPVGGIIVGPDHIDHAPPGPSHLRIVHDLVG